MSIPMQPPHQYTQTSHVAHTHTHFFTLKGNSSQNGDVMYAMLLNIGCHIHGHVAYKSQDQWKDTRLYTCFSGLPTTAPTMVLRQIAAICLDLLLFHLNSTTAMHTTRGIAGMWSSTIYALDMVDCLAGWFNLLKLDKVRRNMPRAKA